MLLMLMACGKAPEMKENTRPPVGAPLTHKSDKEIMGLKYDNVISLFCGVRAANKIIDWFEWKNPSASSLLRILKLSNESESDIIVIRLSSEIEFKDYLNFVDATEREFYMEYTPTLKVQFQSGELSLLKSPRVHDLSQYAEELVVEKAETRLLLSEESEVFCTLRTNINPAYADQWKQIK
jgi:hypothetical protein